MVDGGTQAKGPPRNAYDPSQKTELPDEYCANGATMAKAQRDNRSALGSTSEWGGACVLACAAILSNTAIIG